MSGLPRINGQPDDCGAVCPTCRQRWPDEDGDLANLIRKNIGRVSLFDIAVAASVSLDRVTRIAAKLKPKRRA